MHAPSPNLRLQVEWSPDTLDARRAAWSLTPLSTKVAFRIIHNARRRGKYCEQAITQGTSAIVIFKTRVLCVYSDGSIVQKVAPYPIDGKVVSDPHFDGALYHRTHAAALRNAGDARRRNWRSSARADLTIATMLRLRQAARGPFYTSRR